MLPCNISVAYRYSQHTLMIPLDALSKEAANELASIHVAGVADFPIKSKTALHVKLDDTIAIRKGITAKYLPLGKNTGDPFSDLKNIFPDIFDGTVGRFEGDAELKLSLDAKPVQLPPRAAPHSTLLKLQKELEKMEKDGIIRECSETTDWAHNLVIVTKKNGDLRLCLDPKNLNKGLIRNLHYTASWEDTQSTFNNGRFFSTLDAKSGYCSQELSP